MHYKKTHSDVEIKAPKRAVMVPPELPRSRYDAVAAYGIALLLSVYYIWLHLPHLVANYPYYTFVDEGHVVLWAATRPRCFTVSRGRACMPCMW